MQKILKNHIIVQPKMKIKDIYKYIKVYYYNYLKCGDLVWKIIKYGKITKKVNPQK